MKVEVYREFYDTKDGSGPVEASAYVLDDAKIFVDGEILVVKNETHGGIRAVFAPGQWTRAVASDGGPKPDPATEMHGKE